MKKLMNDIAMMHEKFGFLPANSPLQANCSLMLMRINFLREEMSELYNAYQENNEDDFLDAIIDILVVVVGTAHLAGLFPVLEEAWDRVMTANMLKEKGQGKRGHPMDLVKPAGWKHPIMEDLINRLYNHNQSRINQKPPG